MLNLKNTFTKAIFVFVAISNFAYASDPKFYLGLDASRQDLNLDLDLDTDAVYLDSGIEAKDYYKNNSINPSIFAGIDVLDFLKIEASYTQSSTTKKNNLNIKIPIDEGTTLTSVVQTNYQIKTKTIALDFKPYVKINDKFLAFAIVGASYNKININEKNLINLEPIDEPKGSANKIAPSVGFGLEYFVLPNLALRTQAKYTHLNVKTNNDDDLLLGKIKGMTHVNVGAAYYF